MPAVTGLLASFFADDIAERSGAPRTIPATRPATRCRSRARVSRASRPRCWRSLVYLVALPFLLLAGFGAVIFFLATAFLLGREYFELAAMRFRPPAEAKQLRKANQSTVFLAGLFIAAFVSIPILNLATPLFGTAFMVHMHKRLSGRRAAAADRGDAPNARALADQRSGSALTATLARAVGFRDRRASVVRIERDADQAQRP